MKIKILMLFLTFSLVNSAFADNSETVKAVQILKGDTFVGINYKGVSKIYHLAGVDCAENDTQDGQNAQVYLSQLALNKEIYVTTTVDSGAHALASASQNQGGGGRDIGSEILQNGKCWYRNVDSDNLRSTQKASYGLLQDRAKQKRIGIWKNGMYFSTANPDSWRSLELYKYNQQYVNGATNPAQNDFNRPGTAPTSSAAVQAPVPMNRNGVRDWRTKIGNR
jgi:endonuclease YncB( thermonuclease family)